MMVIENGVMSIVSQKDGVKSIIAGNITVLNVINGEIMPIFTSTAILRVDIIKLKSNVLAVNFLPGAKRQKKGINHA